MANIDKVLLTLENSQDELWLRAKIVLQFIEIREKLGYSQQDVANIMGVSKQLISRFERMENSPTLTFITNYAKALNVEVSTILSMKNINELVLSDDDIKKMDNVVTYQNGEISIDVNFDYEKETIWLTQEQIAQLFEVDRTRITRHIQNILDDGELDNSTYAENAHVQIEGNRKVKRKINFYNLDMIISIGYRVNSKRGIEFRKWVTNILKQYMFEGYAVNQRRINALNKTIEIQNKMLSSTLNVDSKELSNVINEYTRALELLDNYDHQVLSNVKGRETIYRLTYEECRRIIDSMSFNNTSNVFGVEKEAGKLNGILEAVYQNVFGVEVYKTLENKAAHLLYFLVKDHPFVDGCKRIAATLFLEFLNKNHALFRNGELVISNDTLCATTLLVAESNPKDIELLLNIIMNMLSV